MTVTIEQVTAGIVKYIDTELAPKANGITKFMVYFFVPSIPKMVASKIEMLRSSELMNDLFTNEGNINLDEAYKRAQAAMEKSGRLLIPQISYFVDITDLDKLYNLIKTS